MSNTPVTASRTVDCCIVGGGPAGNLFALLLARKGLEVELLEAHGDFDRKFRGDTVHPSTMEIMDQLGLAERVLELPHTKIRQLMVQLRSGPLTFADFSRLPTRFPYIALIPQVRLLNLLAEESAKQPGFHLTFGASVYELLWEEGAVVGVRYRRGSEAGEVRARLVIGADGRFSEVRRLLDPKIIRTSAPMDVLWFTLPRGTGDPPVAQGRMIKGRLVILLDRDEMWQVGYVFPKGQYRALHDQGIEALRESFREVVPEMAERIETLQDWCQVAVLSVESSRVRRWWKPGVLLIGDAAHVMSPVGGMGINYAIQDAVVAANVLTRPLQQKAVRPEQLALVQQRREWAIRIAQALQAIAQNRIVSPALGGAPDVPDWVRLLFSSPLVQQIPARIVGFGIGRPHLEA